MLKVNLNKLFWFVLCIIFIYNKYAWFVPLKDNYFILKGVTINIIFLKISDEFGCKQNKIWVDKGNSFYNRSIKLWLQNNDIEIHLTPSEENSAAPERFFRTLKIKI